MTATTIDQNVLRVSSNNETSAKTEINYKTLKNAAGILRAINHPLRQKMVSIIDEANSLTVTKLYVKLRIEQSVASQHLAILRNAGILNTTRDGKFIYYSVNKNRISEISKNIDCLVN